jgi:hypothetical protein
MVSKIEYVRKKQELTFRISITRRSDCYSRENTVNLVVKKIIPIKWIEWKYVRLGSSVHGSVHHNTTLIKMTNKMQLCRTVYYSIVP